MWIAPEGMIWYCQACGKTSPTKDGWLKKADGKEVFVGQRGWDCSCFIHAVLIPIEQVPKVA